MKHYKGNFGLRRQIGEIEGRAAHSNHCPKRAAFRCLLRKFLFGPGRSNFQSLLRDRPRPRKFQAVFKSGANQ